MPNFKQLAKDYRAGATLQQLSDKTGIHIAELSVRLRGMGVKMRSAGRPKKIK